MFCKISIFPASFRVQVASLACCLDFVISGRLSAATMLFPCVFPSVDSTDMSPVFNYCLWYLCGGGARSKSASQSVCQSVSQSQSPAEFRTRCDETEGGTRNRRGRERASWAAGSNHRGKGREGRFGGEGGGKAGNCTLRFRWFRRVFGFWSLNTALWQHIVIWNMKLHELC